MKSTPGALLTEHKKVGNRSAFGFKVYRTDGEIFGFTDATRDKTVNGLLLKANTGFIRTAIQQTASAAVDNLEVKGGLNSAGLTADDIEAGIWDDAAIEIFRYDWNNPSLGIDKIGKVFIGKTTRGAIEFNAELRGLMQTLQQSMGRLIGPGCDANYGDSRCRVRIDPPAWTATTNYTVRVSGRAETGSVVKPTTPNNRYFKCTTAGQSGGSEPAWNTTIGGTTNDGTVVWTTIQASRVYGSITAVTDPRDFNDAARAEADHAFSNGTIKMTSGANLGITKEILTWTNSTKRFLLYEPFPRTIAVADTYEAVLGCRKAWDLDCRDKHDNVVNHQGYPFVPGTLELVTGGV